MTQVTLQGNPVNLGGSFPAKGHNVFPFHLVNNQLNEVLLSSFEGKRKVLNIFPSIDTGVCATSVRKFNELAAKMDNTVVLCISADLPFAQARFCGAEGIDNVITLSTFRSPEFLQQIGVKILDGALKGLAARAVIVLDEHYQVLYAQLVSEISQEPNYEAALAIL